MKKQDKGFTLVELLIVIVILGILATVTVFAVRGITDQGESNACATELRSVETAIEAFYAQNGQQNPGTMGTTAAAGDLVPSFLKTPPTYVTVTFDGGADGDVATLADNGIPTVAAIDATNCG